MVIWKYILLLSFFEDIYKKWDVTKRYKNVLNSVIIDYFVHYQMFLTIISYTNDFKTKKRLCRLYSIWSNYSTPNYMTVLLQI